MEELTQEPQCAQNLWDKMVLEGPRGHSGSMEMLRDHGEGFGKVPQRVLCFGALFWGFSSLFSGLGFWFGALRWGSAFGVLCFGALLSAFSALVLF